MWLFGHAGGRNSGAAHLGGDVSRLRDRLSEPRQTRRLRRESPEPSRQSRLLEPIGLGYNRRHNRPDRLSLPRRPKHPRSEAESGWRLASFLKEA
jgi:hypothetical protein